MTKSAVIICCLFACNLDAQTVVVNNNLVTPSPEAAGGNLSFRVFQDTAAKNYTGFWFNYQPFTITRSASIALAVINIDEGSDWYLVHEGDIFSPSTIQAGLFTPIVTSRPTSYPAVDLGRVGDVWLGIATSLGSSDRRTVFGWVHLQQFANTKLLMVENVMSYDSPGIIVGTTTLVPEPSTTWLACGLVSLAYPRRVRKN